MQPGLYGGSADPVYQRSPQCEGFCACSASRKYTPSCWRSRSRFTACVRHWQVPLATTAGLPPQGVCVQTAPRALRHRSARARPTAFQVVQHHRSVHKARMATRRGCVRGGSVQIARLAHGAEVVFNTRVRLERTVRWARDIAWRNASHANLLTSRPPPLLRPTQRSVQRASKHAFARQGSTTTPPPAGQPRAQTASLAFSASSAGLRARRYALCRSDEVSGGLLSFPQTYVSAQT
jgi:hypothetical protein